MQDAFAPWLQGAVAPHMHKVPSPLPRQVPPHTCKKRFHPSLTKCCCPTRAKGAFAPPSQSAVAPHTQKALPPLPRNVLMPHTCKTRLRPSLTKCCCPTRAKRASAPPSQRAVAPHTQNALLPLPRNVLLPHSCWALAGLHVAAPHLQGWRPQLRILVQRRSHSSSAPHSTSRVILPQRHDFVTGIRQLLQSPWWHLQYQRGSGTHLKACAAGAGDEARIAVGLGRRVRPAAGGWRAAGSAAGSMRCAACVGGVHGGACCVGPAACVWQGVGGAMCRRPSSEVTEKT